MNEQVVNPLIDVINPIFLVDHENLVDKSIVDYEHHDHSDTSNNAQNLNERSFRWNVEASTKYILLADSYIKVTGQILRYNQNENKEEKLPHSTNIYLKNSGWGIYDSARLTINNNKIEEISENLGTVAHMTDLLSKQKDEFTSVSESEYSFITEEYKQSGVKPHFLEGKQNEDGVFSNTDTKQTKRMKFLTQGSNEFTLILPLNRIFGYLREATTITLGSIITLDLERKTDQLTDLIRVEPVSFDENTGEITEISNLQELRLKILDHKLFIPKVDPNSQAKTYINELIANDSKIQIAYGDFNYFRSREFSQNETTADYTITANKMPKYLFIAPQLKERLSGREYPYLVKDTNDIITDVKFRKLSGHYHDNRVFDHLRLRDISVSLNNQFITKRALITFFNDENYEYITDENRRRQKQDWQELYKKYRDIFFELNGSYNVPISYENFRTNYPLICIDLTKVDEDKINLTTNTLRIRFNIDRTPVNEKLPLHEYPKELLEEDPANNPNRATLMEKIEEKYRENNTFIFHNLVIENKYVKYKLGPDMILTTN